MLDNPFINGKQKKKIQDYDEYWEIRRHKSSKEPKISTNDIIDMHEELKGAKI